MPSLLDCCVPIFVYGASFREGHDDQAETVRARCETLLRDFDREATATGVSPEGVRFALFALVAWLDEVLMVAGWQGRGAWIGSPLQLLLFDTNAAGEEFYLRLDQVRQRCRDGQLPPAVLEIYRACLAMGFHGRLIGSVAREREREDLLKQLGAELTDTDCQAVADSHRPVVGNIHRPRAWVPILVGVLILGLVLAGLSVALDTAVGGVLDHLGDGGGRP